MSVQANVIAAFLLVAPLTTQVHAQGAAPCPCARAAQPGNQTIVIDARTGRVRGPSDVGRKAMVQVVLTEKNPFLYRYELQVSESVVQETALAAFLTQLSPFVGAAIPGPAPGKTAAEDPTPPALTCEAAEKAQPPLTDIRDRYVQLISRTNEGRTAVSAVEESQKIARETYRTQQPVLVNAHASCAELCAAATTLQARLDEYLLAAEPPQTALDFAAATVARVESESKTLMSAVDEFRKNFPLCQPYVAARNELLEIRAYAETVLLGPVASQRARLETLRGDLSRLQAGKELVDRALLAPENFAQERIVGPFPRSTTVSVTAYRANLTDVDGKTKAAVGTHEVNFGGGARFGVSGGVVYSKLRLEEFQQVRGIERGGDGTEINPETMTAIVGHKQNSSRRLLPMLLLHMRALPDDRWLHATFGVSAKKDSEGVDVEYLVGPSVSAVDHRVFVTAGLYYGKRQRLAGDLYLGAKIPDALTAIPVRKRYEAALGLTVTFRIR
jgi:hypothetical protein